MVHTVNDGIYQPESFSGKFPFLKLRVGLASFSATLDLIHRDKVQMQLDNNKRSYETWTQEPLRQISNQEQLSQQLSKKEVSQRLFKIIYTAYFGGLHFEQAFDIF